MSTQSFTSHPFLLGYEHLDRLVELSAKNDGYPPYNIEHTAENTFRITLAVAGFGTESLSVSLAANELIITGVQAEPTEEKVFLHRGIAARQFRRVFMLAEGIDVSHAYMENGLLQVELHRAPVKTKAHKIEINRR